MITATAGLTYSNVYITPPKDKTRGRATRSLGNILSCGVIKYGYPLSPVKMRAYNYRLETTDSNMGGDIANEWAYHAKDFFASYGSAIWVIRQLGSVSKTKTLTVNDMNTETAFTLADIDIYGANGLDKWKDVAKAAPLEILLTGVPTSKCTLDVKIKGTTMTVTLEDITGVLYKVSGDIDKEAVDDYGNSTYIGIKADLAHLVIKVDKDHANFKDDFSITETFDKNALFSTASDDVSIADIEAQAKVVIEDCDYYGSFGQSNMDIIKALRNIAKDRRVISIVDIVGCSTVAEVTTFLGVLGFSEYMDKFLWNRNIYKYKAGNLNIGLSGWYLGKRVAKNQSSKKGIVEDRVNGIGYRDYPITRAVVSSGSILTTDELETLVEKRVNITGDSRGMTVLTDILSGEPKNTFLKNAAVANGEAFLARAIARMIEDELGHNILIAKERLETFVRILFENAEGMNYFDQDAPYQYAYEITDKEGDTIIVSYCYYPTGAVRKGIVEPMLCAVESKI